MRSIMLVRLPTLLTAFVLVTLAACGQAAKTHDRLGAVEVDGTAFRVTSAQGRVVSGKALAGAVLTLVPAGATEPAQVRLDRIIPAPDDAEILLYEMSVLDDASGRWGPMCETDARGERWAFPLQGNWNDQGDRIAQDGWTLVCASGGAVGKCVRWGYKPWSRDARGRSLADHHAACVRMVRADYCGGHGTTRDGMKIDLYDISGVNAPEHEAAAQAGLRFEAAWGPEGALCVAHTRVPENMTIEQLTASCPRLRGRIGPDLCLESQARSGQYGKALVFNWSH